MPRAADAAIEPRVAIVQCFDSYSEDGHQSQMSSQALVGLAVLLGVRYETLFLGELLDETDDFTGVWFSSCMWIDEDDHAELLTYLSAHLDAGGSVFLDGPLGVFYRDGSGVGHTRAMDQIAEILGVDWGGWRSTAGYDVATTTSLHPVANRAGYGMEVALTTDMKSGTDTLIPIDPTAETLIELVPPFGGSRYPFLVVAEPVGGARVAAVGGYGNFGGVASPYRNSPSPAFSDNQVLPYLLETLVWLTASEPSPYAGLQISHTPVTMLGRLDGDWSDVPEATANTLSYLTDLAAETGIAAVYGIVSEYAEAGDTWPVFAELAPALQELGGSIGSHSATHPFDMSEELDSGGWQNEVAGSVAQIRAALETGSFRPDVYAFINPGNTIHAHDYVEFFDDIEVYLSHGYEPYTPYSTGVQGFGVTPRAVINDVVAPDYQWLYSSSWFYTVGEAAALQAQILDFYQESVGRGLVYNMMWHDYSLGGNAQPKNDPDATTVLPLFETSREHFWDSEVYAPTVAELVGKLYTAHGVAITSSWAGELQVVLDYSAVPLEYRKYVAGMGLRVHQADEPIRRVVIDGVEHRGFTGDTVIMPATSGTTQQVVIELGPPAAPDYRLRFASKPVSSATGAGPRVVAELAQPGSAMKYCFVAPDASVVLGADAFARTSTGESCGHLARGNPATSVEIQAFDTGGLELYVRRATRPLSNAYPIASGVRVEYLGGADAVIELASPLQPTAVRVDGAVVASAITAGGFSVAIGSSSSPGALEVSFAGATCEIMEVGCDDGIDDDCDGAIDCADSDCAAGAGCGSSSRLVILTAISDATVRATAPQTNFGANDSIEVDTASVFQYGLIKPDHLGAIAPGSRVVRAELVLQVFNPGDRVEVREVLGGWSESAVTYASAPPLAQGLVASVPAGALGEVVVDVTGLAQGWVDGGRLDGLALFPTGSDGVDLRSTEYSSSSLRPYLAIEVIDGGAQCSAEICGDGIDNDCDGAIDCGDGDCAGSGSCPAAPRRVVVSAISDATVRQTAPATNFGSSGSLEVDTASVFQFALIKPDNLGDIAPGAEVVRAEVVLHVFNPGDAVQVREVLGAWTESAVTWNGAPPLAQSVLPLVSAAAVGEIAVDIRALAQRWVDGGALHGIALYPTGADGVDLYSSEVSPVSLRPTFVFEVIDGGGQCSDDDGDGYLAATCGGDCDDADAATHPGAVELCADGIDNDCDARLDCADSDCDGDSACGAGSVVTVVLEDLDDATVSAASPDTNLGSGASLEIDTWSVRKRAFVKPADLGGLTQGTSIASAQLVLEIYDAGDLVMIAEARSPWSESAINWSNAPASGPAFSSLPAGTSGAIAIDVTDVVQRWVDGDPVHGLVLEPTSSNGVRIRSAEHFEAGARPRLVIEAVQ